MILPIYTYGNAVLRQTAADIEPDYPELEVLIANMFDTLAASEGIGLAAPQIGRAIRVVVIDLDVLADDMPQYKGFRRPYINPHIIEVDESSSTETLEEGCLSIPGIHERVTRHTRIHVVYRDEHFAEHDEWVDGYLARVMQHEFDHLEGTMFVDRISAMRKQMIRGKLKNMIAGKYRCAYRTKPPKR